MEIDGGRYRLIRRLGCGGTGTVYLAADLRLERTVAIKVLHPHLAGALLCGEGRSLARFSHPNVVALHDLLEHEEQPYLVMEYVEGSDLEQWLGAHGPLPLDAALALLRRIAVPVQAAHELGLVHLDLKPSNVLLTSTGGVKLTDFSLARPEHNAPADAVRGGTATYAAPEQLAGDTVDRRADVYALGMLLRRLTGPNMDVAAEYSIEEVITRATAPQPEERFDSVADFLAALPAPIDGETEISVTSSVSDLTRILPTLPVTPARGRRPLWPLSLLPAVAVLVGAVAFSQRPVSASPPPVTLPSLLATQDRSAGAVLRSLHLRVRTCRQYSSALPKGEVLAQQPSAGAQLPPGATVTLTISQGPRLVAVPSLGGVTLTDAQNQLQHAGFVVQVVTHETLFHSAGDVMAQDPAPGVARVPGSTVTLTVSVKPAWWPF